MLIIHIGTHKTGTTSLQSVLARGAEALLPHGIRYLQRGRGDGFAHHKLAWALRGRRNTDMSVWDRLRAELAASKSPTNLLSSEAFWLEDPAEVKRQLGDTQDVRIVLYVRRQDKYLQSLYKQTVASGRKPDFAAWLAEMHVRGDYLSVVRNWAAQFGADAVTVLPYERDGRPIDLVADFSRFLGVDLAALVGQKNVGTQNPSPRRELLHFIRALNQLDLDVNHDKFFYSVIKRNKSYIRSTDLLTYEQRVELMRGYADGNRILSDEFHAGVPLFPEMVPTEPPALWTLDDAEFFALTVDVLDAVVKLVAAGEIGPREPKPGKNGPAA